MKRKTLTEDQIEEILSQSRVKREIYHDLMQFRVREILLVSTYYDAFSLEEEGQLTDKIFDEYYNLNLTNAPRVTHVVSGARALEEIETRSFDLVVLMLRIEDITPWDLSKSIKTAQNNLPVLLLLKDNAEIAMLRVGWDGPTRSIDQVFVWNGDSRIFVAMIKYIEDAKNVDNDTRVGLVRVILLVEDSIRACSRYLPVLYSEIMKQTQRLIFEEKLNPTRKVLRMRARPKILVADNCNDAMAIVQNYRDNLLCVISDVSFNRDGSRDEEAGLKLIQAVKDIIPDLPTVLQSSDSENEPRAHALNSLFIDKNSDQLGGELRRFIVLHLGFGDFVFRNNRKENIGTAATIYEMETLLLTIPAESLRYHGVRNNFSAWLMARGEIAIARIIQPLKIDDFDSDQELREFLVNVFSNVRRVDIKGKVIEFSSDVLEGDGYILRLANGSLGGKGRGLAYINSLIQATDLETSMPGARICIPRTAIIGTEAFDQFIAENDQVHLFQTKEEYGRVQQDFLKGTLSKDLISKLKLLLDYFTGPLAIRSSGLFEDSISHPFSGVYPTFVLPNNHPSPGERMRQLTHAIKLVFSAVFESSARQYFDAVNYKIEEEKMAVIIQELVGNRHEDWFLPHFSGVAQSYNYYPFGYIKPEDGVAATAVGLGKYVVEGEKAYRFCPRYPKLNVSTTEEAINNSQNHFLALDMAMEDPDLTRGEDATLVDLNISEAERLGILDQLVSVWDYQNDRMQEGLYGPGPRIMNFAPILKFETFPLARILDLCLSKFRVALGTPVEVEFAVDLTRDKDREPTLYLLQVKHFMRNIETFAIEPDTIRFDDCLIYTQKSMGNGRVDDLRDIIYIDPDAFDRSATLQMGVELEKLNARMRQEDRKYILIGPGRWGTRDHWLGIPIIWTQISQARVIVEADLEGYHVDSSQGSHFFHNITSMNIGYLSARYHMGPKSGDTSFVDWDWLKEQPVVDRTRYAVRVRLDKPLTVLMDGRKRIAVVYKPGWDCV